MSAWTALIALAAVAGAGIAQPASSQALPPVQMTFDQAVAAQARAMAATPVESPGPAFRSVETPAGTERVRVGRAASRTAEAIAPRVRTVVVGDAWMRVAPVSPGTEAVAERVPTVVERVLPDGSRQRIPAAAEAGSGAASAGP